MRNNDRTIRKHFSTLAWTAILLILITGWAGCDRIVPSNSPTEFQLDLARAAAASIFAFTPGGDAPQPPSPSPTPTPSPSEKCERCNGTGRIKPDGRIEIACPDCGGDGKLELLDFVKLVAELRKEIVAMRRPKAIPTQPVPTVADLSWYTSISTARKDAARTSKPVLLHFYTEVCEPCKRMDDEIFSDSSVRAAISRDYIACRVDANLLTNVDRRNWEITTVPCDVVVSPNWTKKWTLRRTFNAQMYENQLIEARAWAETVAEEAKEKSVVPATKPVDKVLKPVRKFFNTNAMGEEIYLEPSYYEPPIHYQTYYTSPAYYSTPTYYAPVHGCANGVCW